MKELRDIVAAAGRLAASGEEGVLVTLVKTEGSSYRKAGARMLVLLGCRTVGMISGGCLEGEAARQAWALTRGGKTAVFVLDSTSEERDWSPATGCLGKLFLLAEPIAAGAVHPTVEVLGKILAGERSALVMHAFETHGDGALEFCGTRLAETAVGWETQSRWLQHEGFAEFAEVLSPVPHLLICGAGDDAQPLAKFAGTMGWNITVVDSRPRLATQARFAQATVCDAGPASVASLVRAHTLAVIMSHRFGDDAEYLAYMLSRNLRYVGLLGPQARTQRLLEKLAERGVRPTEEQLARVFNPVGLDLGGRDPESIALAIVAQIQTVLTQQESLFRSPTPVTEARTSERPACPR